MSRHRVGPHSGAAECVDTECVALRVELPHDGWSCLAMQAAAYPPSGCPARLHDQIDTSDAPQNEPPQSGATEWSHRVC